MKPKSLNLYLDVYKIENNIYKVVFDNKNEKYNFINEQFLIELDSALDIINEDKSVNGVIFSSAKENSFIVGADIKAINQLQNESIAKAYDASMAGRNIFNKIKTLKCPTIALINGLALGGGLEITLFCSYRIGSQNESAKLGLPEVQLGILPAWGGTVNLPNLIGISQAAPLILNGNTISHTKAKFLGIVNELQANENMLSRACELIKNKDFIKPKYPLIRLFDDFLLPIDFISNFYFNKVKQTVDRVTKKHYVAPYRIIDIIRKLPASQNPEKIYQLESLAFSELLHTHQCVNILKIFNSQNSSKKVDGDVIPIKTIGVVGAGVMGASIAQLIAYSDYKVILKDVQQDFLDKGLKTIKDLFNNLLEKKKITQAKYDEYLSNITTTLNYSDFADCDLVIEAVIEDFEAKLSVLNEIAKINSKQFIFATNTSSLSVENLANKSSISNRVIGIHFFNPVHKMNLVEIVTTSKCDKSVVNTAKSLVLKLNKTPVEVKSSPGFIVNRILGPYMLEAARLASAKVSITKIDKALKKFGMPMGPFELLDEVGLDIASKVSHILCNELGDRMQPSDLLDKLLAQKMLGKKSKCGIYQYNENNKKTQLNPYLLKILFNADEKTIEEQKLYNNISEEEITDRLVLVMVNEAIRLMQAKIVESASELDLAMVLGTGFAPFHGGVLSYADYVGLENIIQKLSVFEQNIGKNYEVQNLLKELVQSNRNFYDL